MPRPSSGHSVAWPISVRMMATPPRQTPLFVLVTIAEGSPSASPEPRSSPATGEAPPGRIEVDLRSGRLLFHGAVDPGLEAAVIASARGRG